MQANTYLVALSGIKRPSFELIPKSQLLFTAYVNEEGFHCISDDDLRLEVFSRDELNLHYELDRQIAFLWREFVMCPADNLEPVALALRHKLQSMFTAFKGQNG